MKVSCAALLCLFLLFSGGGANAQTQSELEALNKQVKELGEKGKYAEALPIAESLVAQWERLLGPDDRNLVIPLSNLAQIYDRLGRFVQAEQVCKRAVAINDKTWGPDNLISTLPLNSLGNIYMSQGRFAEAEPIFKHNLALLESKLSPEHTAVLLAVNNLALFYSRMGRYDLAEQFLNRALAAREKTQGLDHPDIAQTLNDLAQIYLLTNRFAEAERLFTRALAMREKTLGRDNYLVGLSCNDLAIFYSDLGRYAEAEPLYQRALAILRKAGGEDHPLVGRALSNFGALYHDIGRYAEAERLYKQSLANVEKSLGPDHADLAISLNNLAELYRSMQRHAEAEPLYQRALSITERALGADHPQMGAALANLAGVYTDQQRYGEAELLYKRSLSIREQKLGAEHPSAARTMSSLGILYERMKRTAEAETLFKRALAIFEKVLGPDHNDTAITMNNLAALYSDQHKDAEAEQLYKRSLEISERFLGPDHPSVATKINNLGSLYSRLGRFAEAEALFKRSRDIYTKALGSDHPSVARSLGNLANVALQQENWRQAVEEGRSSTGITIRRAKRNLEELGAAVTGRGRSEAAQAGGRFRVLVKAAYRLAAQDRGAEQSLATETFQAAQWSQSSDAAASIAKMSVRQAGGDTDLSRLVRQRQDLVAEWQTRDVQRNTAISNTPEKRNRDAEAANLARLGAIDAQLADIDKKLIADFPEYTALANPEPLAIADVQPYLREDEAFVLILDTPKRGAVPEETFLWVITKTQSRWVSVAAGTETLRREVQALRCGLDAAAWTGPHCNELTGKVYTDEDAEGGRPLPFDLARAHELYKALFEPVADLVAGKALLLVPSGALTQVPFQVLITGKPGANTAFAEAAWLIKSHALTVLPSVASLKALREFAKSSPAGKNYFGVGNPLLDGEDSRDARRAKRAQEKRSCAGLQPQTAEAPKLRRGVHFPAFKALDAELIRMQPPLPETADEVCTVAKGQGASDDDLRLGSKATETEIKELNSRGALADYRIIHFATHGAMAGQLGSSVEPGLILTPPAAGTDEDDGYLSASEIAALRLNADWVILSACNTAAGNTEDAEALSGLARAFFYAGARAMLVSHWAVASRPTVQLTTRSFDEARANVDIGRAEALRRSMRAMIGGSDKRLAHPAFWSPFVLVGEGAR